MAEQDPQLRTAVIDIKRQYQIQLEAYLLGESAHTPWKTWQDIVDKYPDHYNRVRKLAEVLQESAFERETKKLSETETYRAIFFSREQCLDTSAVGSYLLADILVYRAIAHSPVVQANAMLRELGVEGGLLGGRTQHLTAEDIIEKVLDNSLQLSRS